MSVYDTLLATPSVRVRHARLLQRGFSGSPARRPGGHILGAPRYESTMPAALQPSPAAAHHNEARAKHAAKPSCDVLLGTDEQYKLIT